MPIKATITKLRLQIKYFEVLKLFIISLLIITIIKKKNEKCYIFFANLIKGITAKGNTIACKTFNFELIVLGLSKKQIKIEGTKAMLLVIIDLIQRLTLISRKP